MCQTLVCFISYDSHVGHRTVALILLMSRQDLRQPGSLQPCHAQASLPLFTPVCRVLLGTPSPVSVLPSRCLHTCAPVPSLLSALSPSVLKGSGPGHFPMCSKAHHCLSLAALAVVMEMRGPGGCSPILSFQPWLLCLCVCGPVLFAETPPAIISHELGALHILLFLDSKP